MNEKYRKPGENDQVDSKVGFGKAVIEETKEMRRRERNSPERPNHKPINRGMEIGDNSTLL